MKTLYTFLAMLFAILSQAQIDNRTETDCDGNSQSIYEILETGKPLIIASKGLDCSTCMSQADNLADFANSQPNIAVWGAMFYLYANQEADCPSILNWETSYDWNNIFSFPDLEEYWAGNFGAPTYHVIDPSSAEIVYSGGSFSSASSAALQLTTVGLNEAFDTESFLLYTSNGNLNIELKSNFEGTGSLKIFNILGEQVFSKNFRLKSDDVKIQSPFSENSGVYIANLEISGEIYSKKFLLKN